MASSESPNFHSGWRVVLAVLGLAALGSAGFAWLRPPKHLQFAPQCPPPAVDAGAGTASATNCVGEVDSDGSSVAVALLGLGTFLIVLAANGRRLASLKLPGGSETTFEDPAKKAREILRGHETELDPTDSEKAVEPPQETQPTAAAVGHVTIDGRDLSLFALRDVPANVVRDLLVWLSKESIELPRNLDADLVARQTGRGNFPWFIKFRELPQTFRVSYGGQGKRGEATIKIVSGA